MTAEIVIMNKNGVALAADSAATMINSKVYNSANKLFALSKRHPVAIMVYEAGAFLGVPWEILIKQYRTSSLGNRSFETTKEYYEHFLSFLSTTPILTEQDESESYFGSIAVAFQKMKERVNSHLRKFPSPAGANDRDLLSRLQTQQLMKFVNEVNKDIDSCSFDGQLRNLVHSKYSGKIAGILVASFPNISFSDTQIATIVNACVDILGTNKHLANYTGIVIVGFGEKEIFPSLYKCTVETRVLDWVTPKNEESEIISNGNRSAIKPFAQREMVDLFMCGIDDRVKSSLSTSFDQAIKGLPGKVSTLLGITPTDNQAADMRELAAATVKSLDYQYEEHMNKNFLEPLHSSVRLLPLNELVLMAKTLVNLTSFKRRVSHSVETVGGPIDIAVISKGDGLIWIERKNYFPKELNSDFYQRRYGGSV